MGSQKLYKDFDCIGSQCPQPPQLFKGQLYSEEEELGTVKEKNDLNWFGGKTNKKKVFSGEILELRVHQGKSRRLWVENSMWKVSMSESLGKTSG